MIAGRSLEQLGAGSHQTRVTLAYLADIEKYREERPYALEFEIPLPDERYRTNVEFESRNVSIRSLRLVDKSVTIEDHGFEIYKVPQDIENDHFIESDQLREMDGVAKIMKTRFETGHVFCHTHRVRAFYRSWSQIVS